MTFWAVEGGAGVGKTTRLLARLVEHLAVQPLGDNQRVLAMTFMHGSRRRLDDRLQGMQGSGSRFAFECATIDSFAYRLLRRWASLANRLALADPDSLTYEERCNAAAQLLQRGHVRAWVAARYPVLLIDEAQDLVPERLRIIQNLAVLCTTLVAADEFQCLNETLRPNPSIGWIREMCDAETLTTSRRTEIGSLLACARALRSAEGITVGKGMQIKAAKGLPFAAAITASAIAWNTAATVAVITPSLQGGFAQSVVERVSTTPCGKNKHGPYPIQWERTARDSYKDVLEALSLTDSNSYATVTGALRSLPRNWMVRALATWLDAQHWVMGRENFSRAEIEEALNRQAELRSHHFSRVRRKRLAMTIQQAKNREFDGVIVLWPYQVAGDAEHKRRLLYNGITRAKRWCTVVVQNESILAGAPFA